jgi:hypothetical protein
LAYIKKTCLSVAIQFLRFWLAVGRRTMLFTPLVKGIGCLPTVHLSRRRPGKPPGRKVPCVLCLIRVLCQIQNYQI